jgi:hypothetical protein
VSDFAGDLKKFSLKCEVTVLDDFVDVTNEVQRSATKGSEITGAPGVPVQSGFLLSSYIPRFLSKWSWVTETNAPYAKSIEDGASYAHGGTPLTLRSPVGGFHSVALTIAGFQRIVDTVIKRNAK